MAAGLVDRLQVTIFPAISGRTGTSPILRGAGDFDLELLESRTLDGHTGARLPPDSPMTEGAVDRVAATTGPYSVKPQNVTGWPLRAAMPTTTMVALAPPAVAFRPKEWLKVRPERWQSDAPSVPFLALRDHGPEGLGTAEHRVRRSVVVADDESRQSRLADHPRRIKRLR